jgi:DNA-binding HxlR family transcriptional regulator
MNEPTLETIDQLEIFFKTLVEAERLQIAGLLARKPHSAEQLAEQLKIKPAALAHHLEKLIEAGLVHFEMKARTVRYTLHLEAAHKLAARLAATRVRPTLSEDLVEFDRKVLTQYLSADGALKEIPAQDKKMLVLLRYINATIEPGRRYTEKQLNALLARFHTDVATLRRYLIDFKFMQRTVTGSEYWREA